MPDGRRRCLFRSWQLARCILGFSDACDGAGHRTSVGRAIPPHHFAGVATVVTKLFNVVRPGLAFFDKKTISSAGSCGNWSRI